jgi:hypothetical protein
MVKKKTINVKNDERHEEDAIGATPRLVEHGKI